MPTTAPARSRHMQAAETLGIDLHPDSHQYVYVNRQWHPASRVDGEALRTLCGRRTVGSPRGWFQVGDICGLDACTRVECLLEHDYLVRQGDRVLTLARDFTSTSNSAVLRAADAVRMTRGARVTTGGVELWSATSEERVAALMAADPQLAARWTITTLFTPTAFGGVDHLKLSKRARRRFDSFYRWNVYDPWVDDPDTAIDQIVADMPTLLWRWRTIAVELVAAAERLLARLTADVEAGRMVAVLTGGSLAQEALIGRPHKGRGQYMVVAVPAAVADHLSNLGRQATYCLGPVTDKGQFPEAADTMLALVGAGDVDPASLGGLWAAANRITL